MTTAYIIEQLKIVAAVFAVAFAIFFGYSVVGYVAENVSAALAANCSTCGVSGGFIINLDGGGGYGGGGYADGGGGGGGGGHPTPYCTLILTEGPIQSASYPPVKQYILTWVAPYASSFSISNGIGTVSPPTGGTHTFTTSATPGQYTGTAVTPYGTVTCQTAPLPIPPPTCVLTTSTSQCQPSDNVTLSWTTSNATALSIAPGIGSVTPVPAGSTTVNPTVTTTYVGTVTGPGGTATCNTTVTVTPPPPTPPQCTLDLTKDVITWTSTNATTVVINPLTNSPQVPGGTGGGSGNQTFAHGEADAYNSSAVISDLAGDGINLPSVQGNTGFASDQTTMNQVCALIHGSGSVASQIGARSYSSPGNNRVVKFNGTSWSLIGASSFNSHLSSSFTCSGPTTPTTWPLSGSFNFVPPLGVGTHTYQLTATGPGGVVQCTKTVVVPPQEECKLEITKTANKTTVAPNGTVEYTVSFTNVGDKKCTGSGVKVQDTLDSRFTYQSETHSANITAGYGADPVYKAADRTVRFNAWDLDPAETGWFKIVVKAGTPTACSETVPNKAKITSYEYNNFNTFVDSNTVNVAIAKDCTPPPPTECKLEITKTASVSTTTANTPFEYTITVKNIGTKNCTGGGVKVWDTLDSQLTYQSETHSSNITAGYGSDPVYKSSDRTVRFNADTLTPGESGWMKIKVKAGTPTTCSVTIPNKAKVTAYEYNNFQDYETSNTVNVAVEKDCTPPPTDCKLELEKSANKTTVAANGTIEYTINIKNTGSKKCTGSGVKLIDVLDEGLVYQSETHSANITAGYQSEPVYKSSTRTLYWNAWDLDPSETGWVKFIAKAATPTACTESVPNKAKATSFEYNNFNTWVESNVMTVSVTKDCHVPVPYCTMSANPTGITQGGSATLTWNSTNVTSAVIDQGVGTVALSGSKSVSPSTTTTYTGTFTGPGGTVTCTATVGVVPVETPLPQCTLAISASSITPGQSVIVSWTSQNANKGFITSVGTTSPVAGGSSEVFPSDSMTFVGTFSGHYGTTTCSVPVTVIKPGCTSGCAGGGLNQPNVVLLQKPPEAPLAFVTLDEIPYTGFEAGKALTLAFWIAVGLLAAITTYFVMGRGGMQFILGGALSAVGVGDYEEMEERAHRSARVPNQFQGQDSAAYNGGHAQGNVEYATGYANGGRSYETNYAASTMAAPAPVYTAPAMAAPVAVAPAARPAVDGIPELADVIEGRAHGAGVLMSPEAVAMALGLSADRGEALRIFGEILNEAVKTLPREDGWIMLTSEHFAELKRGAVTPATMATVMSTPSVESILSSVMAQPAARVVPTVNVEMPMSNTDDQEVVMALGRAILAGNRDVAYSTVRNLEVAGANATTVMTIIAGAFDQLYRARRHGLTTELTVPAMAVSDEALAKMVEVMTHGMDHGYSNAFTSLKLAVAQAFEARG